MQQERAEIKRENYSLKEMLPSYNEMYSTPDEKAEKDAGLTQFLNQL
jgi:hypothetical protein